MKNCTELIVEFCKEKVGISVSASTIDRALRVGRKTEKKIRRIVVKVMSYNS